MARPPPSSVWVPANGGSCLVLPPSRATSTGCLRLPRALAGLGANSAR